MVRRRALLVTTGFMLATTLDAPAAGIPVFDALGLVQTTMTAMESVSQTAKLIEAYRTQLQQYEDQIRNSIAPGVYIWDRANQTIRDVLATIDTLEQYKRQFGTLEAYLDQYRDLDHYRLASCFAADGCIAQMQGIVAAGSAGQKRANDAMVMAIDKHQSQLKEDAAKLEQLQQNAQTAQGRMEAIQLANQLASQQSHQLMQIRTLLVQQQSASVALSQTINAHNALQHAADEKARAGEFRPGINKGY